MRFNTTLPMAQFLFETTFFHDNWARTRDHRNAAAIRRSVLQYPYPWPELVGRLLVSFLLDYLTQQQLQPSSPGLVGWWQFYILHGAVLQPLYFFFFPTMRRYYVTFCLTPYGEINNQPTFLFLFSFFSFLFLVQCFTFLFFISFFFFSNCIFHNRKTYHHFILFFLFLFFPDLIYFLYL